MLRMWSTSSDRAARLLAIRRWVLQEHCSVVAVLGIGGIGKTSIAAKLAQEVAPAFERVYWRGLRDAPPFYEWMTGAIGSLSGHQLVTPTTMRTSCWCCFSSCEISPACWSSTT